MPAHSPAIDWKAVPIPDPAFDAAPLRRHGDRLLGAVAYAVRNGVFTFAQPDWPQRSRALRDFSKTIPVTLIRAIEEHLLSFGGGPDPQQARRAMMNVFGFDPPHHFFYHLPVDWVRLTEPQATKGLAHFLNVDDRAIGTGRILALLKALGYSPKDPNAVFSKARAEAEAPVRAKRRIDLLLQWQDGSGFDRGAVIEAKFGDDIRSGQLSAYRRHLQRIERQYRRTARCGGHEQPLLFVVSPQRRMNDVKALGRNRDWRWTAWHSLLLAYDRALDADHDDDAFRQFRRTLWDRAAS